MTQFTGVTQHTDPKSVDFKKLQLSAADQKMYSFFGWDAGQKFTKKARKGFPYEKVAQDSAYFSAYKDFYNCIEENTKEGTQLNGSQMEEA